ncbi:Cys-tRNA(Pro)/Cys-tRNA(Cys) deacylase [Luteococcus japonicus]|uniref:Cys-tRNA(Pro)/Cys-tRNA(Cys) deacylase n=2 Tax=Luteococcus japonicus TaxID=33984 RepID=A0A1R4JKY8_9ACTN|nr:Cys-tRNA(Pro) deacylase [Luteococcus japonicus]ROR53068.1 Cys-tRNA(Pro)/Cys-tRNA(Cys) deacylase [Luteococcus japonicus]SJN32453.1 Cys-tRNA(Pro) deacylase YbaK [Luteococcus japonicus LSP_Lj1]
MSTGTPATKALDRAKVPHTLLPYEHDPANVHFGDEAVLALGQDPHQVFKTLVVACTGGPSPLVVAVVPVAQQLDLKALASEAGAKRAALADHAVAERTTGYVVGGISPLGQRKSLPTFIDASAQAFATMMVSAGKRGLQVELSPADLARVTRASFVAIAR